MTKVCNSCKHTWTNTVYACARCGSTDLNYSETPQLPMGYKAPEIKYIDPTLEQWYKRALEAIKKMPKES